MVEKPTKRQQKFLMLQIKKKKKLCFQRKDYSQQTRITIGVAFPRRRALKEEKGLRADTDVALLSLDRLVFVKYLE